MDQHAPWRAIEETDAETASTGSGDAGRQTSFTVPRWLLAVGGAGLLAVCAAVVVFAAALQPQQLVLQSPHGTAPEASPAVARIVIEVAGAVVRPGVYELPVGSRVADAIEAAGGYRSDVDTGAADSALNLAGKLVDAQMIRIPGKSDPVSASGRPAETGTAANAASGVLDLNTASLEQLDTLPGIGPVTASKIVAAREEKPFDSVDELVTRKLVSTNTLAKFRDRVTVH